MNITNISSKDIKNYVKTIKNHMAENDKHDDYYAGYSDALQLAIDSAYEDEKVQLSKHVADWLDYCKSSSRSLQYAIDHATAYKENNPVAAAYLARGDEHLLTFVRAWFEGFTIENNEENGVCDQKLAENQQRRNP